jgi:hypothetical protein
LAVTRSRRICAISLPRTGNATFSESVRRKRIFWSGGEIGHQPCEKFETGKLDGVNLQSTPADEAQKAGDALWRLDAARATPK